MAADVAGFNAAKATASSYSDLGAVPWGERRRDGGAD